MIFVYLNLFYSMAAETIVDCDITVLIDLKGMLFLKNVNNAIIIEILKLGGIALDLNTLNKEQLEAVKTVDGPLLILAGAGSGKTRVITYRVAHLIETGVYPGNILAITFTNKAADEMKERVIELVGEEAKSMWISTFHSACVRILRVDIEKLGYNKNFVIYDSQEQEKLIDECLKELNFDNKIYKPREILSKIGSLKDTLTDEEDYYKKYADDFKNKVVARTFLLYQKKLKNSNALDFDDIINKTVKLFQTYPDVLNHYQRKFRYILVDEYQDTNRAQYELINLLAKGHKNLCVVGDDDQCLLQGTLVNVPSGKVPIENIKENDKLICASGHGEVTVGTADKVMRKEYEGPIIKIKTAKGHIIKGTPNHIGFAKINVSPDSYYVYLMYKKNLGYRIGQTRGVRSRKGQLINGMFVRLNQEHADKMWILRVCENKGEASYYENYFSAKYGIPMVVFSDKGRNISMDQEMINKLFKEIDTFKAVENLMRENMIFKEYPHHMCNAVIRGQSTRRIININFFSGKKYISDNFYSHRISLNTTGDELESIMKKNEHHVRPGQRNTWRIETERKEYDDADSYAKKISQQGYDLEILRRARLTEGKSFMFMPFSHMRPTMSIPVYENGEIIEDVIEDVSVEDYKGYVYDISIPHLRQYICENVVVHNCVYGWRGADIRNILDFEKDYPSCKVIKLEQNYRCTKKILDAANYVIANNEQRKPKKLWTENKTGDNVKFYRAENERGEARFILDEIKSLTLADFKYKDVAILYRNNAMSRVLEEALITNNMPYKVIGGFRFYDRMEVKDIMAYLKVINNPLDNISILRIVNVPKRGIGASTIDNIREYANQKGISIYSAMLESERIDGLNSRALNAVQKFTSLMESLAAAFEKMDVPDLINEVIEKTGYVDELKKENTKESTERIENIQEFYSAALEFKEKSEDKSLSAFLEKLALVSDQDSLDGNGGITLMTLHTAKGLEFPVVFIAGCEDGIFPHYSARDDKDELEEERRLCYVGITRAKQKLYMTCAKQRMLFGRIMFNPISMFVDEIPETYVDDLSKNDSSLKVSYDYNSIFNYKKTENNFLNQPSYVSQQTKPVSNSIDSNDVRPGSKINHKMFGCGTIVSIKDSDSGKIITVAFDKGGIKNLILNSAPIEIIS